MALAILDGTQTATTLSTILTSGQHITAHTIVSLGTQSITDITGAVSGSVVTIPNLNVLARSVATDGIADGTLNFVKIGGHQDGSNQTAHIVHVSTGGAMKVDASDSTVTFGAVQLRAGTTQIGSVTASISNSVTIASLPAISGTVTAGGLWFDGSVYVPTPLSVGEEGQLIVFSYLQSAIPAGTNRIGVVTIGAGTVTIGAGTAQIGSVTASISNFPATQAISIASVTIGNSVTIGSLPLIAGTVTANGGDFASPPLGAYPAKALRIGFANDEQYNAVGLGSNGKPLPVILYNTLEDSIGSSVSGSIPLVISGTVTANTFAVQGTAVTTSNFTSTTASTVLANFNSGREVLTIFNEGAGNLHICPGATCTTIAYQVRLSSGDYYEVPNHQTTITHSAVFATAGTARVTEVS